MGKESSYISDEYLVQYWEPFAATFSREKTRNDYFSNICSLCDYIKKDVLEANEEDVECYIRHLLAQVRAGRLKQSTVNLKASILHAVYNDLMQRGGYKQGNPVRKDDLPQVSVYLRPDEIPNEGQMDEILSRAKADPMMYAVTALIIRCALTSGEIVSLRIDDIIMDEKDHAVMVFCYRNEKRYVKIPSDVLQIIQSYLRCREGNSAYLFCNRKGNALRLRDLERRYKKCIYPDTEVVFTLQALRNGAITLMLQCGAPEDEVAKYVNIDFRWIKRYNLAVDLSREPTEYVNIRIINPYTKIQAEENAGANKT